MKIIDPGDSSHIIQIIPRTLNVDNVHTFTLRDEDLRTDTDISNTKAINGGYIDYTITLTTTEGKSYSVKITDDTTTLVVWRGKIFSTAQITQKYVINE